MRIVPSIFISLLLAINLVACSPVVAPEGMIAVSSTLIVEKSIPKKARVKLVKDIASSKQKVATFFGGEMLANPIIYACESGSCLSQFGGEPAAAKAIGSTKVILSEEGRKPELLMHEMVHIEFHHRLGGKVNLHKVPMWFDEGLAIIACDENPAGYARHTLDLTLNDLHSEKQWLNAYYSNSQPYEVARDAVSNWFKREGTEGLLGLIDEIKRTGEFPILPQSKLDFYQ